MNRQPVFTDIPILVSKTFDPPINENSYNLSNNPSLPTSIFTATDVSGSLIERITVSGTGDRSNATVTAKLIYLCIYDDTTATWSLCKTAAMHAATVDDTVPNPEIEWVFTGGLLLPENFQLGIAASKNSAGTSEKGDYVAVTVEGSSYTTV